LNLGYSLFNLTDNSGDEPEVSKVLPVTAQNLAIVEHHVHNAIHNKLVATRALKAESKQLKSETCSINSDIISSHVTVTEALPLISVLLTPQLASIQYIILKLCTVTNH